MYTEKQQEYINIMEGQPHNCAVDMIGALESENTALKDIVHHVWIHSAYRDCGYMHMTTEQKALFDSVVNRQTPNAEVTGA